MKILSSVLPPRCWIWPVSRTEATARGERGGERAALSGWREAVSRVSAATKAGFSTEAGAIGGSIGARSNAPASVAVAC